MNRQHKRQLINEQLASLYQARKNSTSSEDLKKMNTNIAQLRQKLLMYKPLKRR